MFSESIEKFVKGNQLRAIYGYETLTAEEGVAGMEKHIFECLQRLQWIYEVSKVLLILIVCHLDHELFMSWRSAREGCIVKKEKIRIMPIASVPILQDLPAEECPFFLRIAL